jgi:hypothetical protein
VSIPAHLVQSYGRHHIAKHINQVSLGHWRRQRRRRGGRRRRLLVAAGGQPVPYICQIILQRQGEWQAIFRMTVASHAA